MNWGKRGPGSPTGRRRGSFLPWSERLEDRRLLTGTLDLATVQSSSLGVEMVGAAAGNAAGYTVTDVGDVTGSGYDSFVVASTGITTPTTTFPADFGTSESAVYLVFGSKQVNATNAANFLSLPTGERAGDLAQLGTLGTNNLGQFNPTVMQPASPALPIYGFNFDGLTLVTGLDTTTGLGRDSALGFSVAALGDLNGSGYDDFAISAPNDAGGGKVFVIYGGPQLTTLATTAKTLDLEPTPGTNSTTFPTKLVSFDIPSTSSEFSATNYVGYSVAGIGNFLTFGNSAKDLAIGVPGLTPTGGFTSAGAVFTISSTLLNSQASGANVDLTTTGGTTAVTNRTDSVVATGGNGGIEYIGYATDQYVGASVSTAGNFDNATTSSNQTIDDLLIGAPGVNGNAGAAFLVYGSQLFSTNNTLGSTISLLNLGMTPTTNPTFNPVNGIQLLATAVTGLFGFSVSSAGDYNGDGAGDIIIGSPGAASSQGYAVIIYGQAPTSTVARINGIFNVGGPGSTSSSFSSLYFQGTTAGDEAGYSVTDVGDISGEGINGVAIGAPGYSSGSGTAYVIPGNYSLTGTQQLSAVGTSATLAGTQLVISSSFPGTTAYLGASVSGLPLFITPSPSTVDGDAIPDLIVGAPGFSLTDPQTGNTDERLSSGAGFYLSGASLGIGIPNNVLLTGAGVNSNVPNSTYTLTTTGAATFYIFSAAATSTLPAFDPATELTSPITLVINGVTFTNVTLTTGKDSTGADDVSFNLTAAQVASLGLTTTSTSITIRGTTTAATVFVAKATVTVTAGGGGGGGGGGSISTPTAASILAPPIFTGLLSGQEFPSIQTLNTLASYQPIPVQLAYQEFLPAPGFLARQEVYQHPSKKNQVHQAPAGTERVVSAIRGSAEKVLRYNTLTQSVRDRGKIPLGKTVKFTHKVKVVPTTEQSATFVG